MSVDFFDDALLVLVPFALNQRRGDDSATRLVSQFSQINRGLDAARDLSKRRPNDVEKDASINEEDREACLGQLLSGLGDRGHRFTLRRRLA